MFLAQVFWVATGEGWGGLAFMVLSVCNLVYPLVPPLALFSCLVSVYLVQWGQ